MEIRKITPKDYDTILPWFKLWNWKQTPTPELLSPRGFAVVMNDTILAAVWIYMADAGWAWLEFLVANPTVEKELRLAGTDRMMEAAILIAKEYGAQRVITTTVSSRLAKRWEEQGLNPAGSGIYHLAKGFTDA